MNDQGIKERTRWAIVRVVQDRGLTNKTIAPLVGVSSVTVNNYRTKNRYPKSSFIKEFCKAFGFNEEWFYTGQGEPFPGARAKYPEVCGPGISEPPPVMVGGAPSAQRAPHSEDAAEFSIAEDLTLAAKVLESRTHYATALHLNIRSFAGAVDDVMTLRQMNGVLTRLQELESTIASLQAENKALRTDINRLKATYENPGTGTGSLAATAE